MLSFWIFFLIIDLLNGKNIKRMEDFFLNENEKSKIFKLFIQN